MREENRMDFKRIFLLSFIIGKIWNMYWRRFEWRFLVGFYCEIVRAQDDLSPCTKQIQNGTLIFNCSPEIQIEDLDIDEGEDWSTIEKLRVIGRNSRGPLTKIPASICRLTKLKVHRLWQEQLFVFLNLCLSYWLAFRSINESDQNWSISFSFTMFTRIGISWLKSEFSSSYSHSLDFSNAHASLHLSRL